MKRLVTAIQAERNWLPLSNALCPWCPYYQQGCSLYRSPGEGTDTMTDWLEGAP
jgi:hypothetical protein